MPLKKTPKLNIKLLKELSEAAGAPGFEGRIREIVKRELKGHVDSMEVDNMGNLIALKKGTLKKGKMKLMAAAHMDEIGFMVQHIDDKGFIHFCPLGGFDPKTLSSQRVIIHGKKDVIGVLGGKAAHLMSAEERKVNPQLKDYFIDTGLDKKELDKLVSVGDSITRQRHFVEMGDCVNGKSLDNRMLVFVLIETLKRLKKVPHDFYAVFTVQEEVGLRGAKVAVHSIQPDFGICLDVTLANDIPGVPSHQQINSLGKGASIDVMNSSVIADRRMVNYLRGLADKKKIIYQVEAMDVGGTDAHAMQMMTEKGCITGGISVPLRNMHQEVEMCHQTDIKATLDLLQLAVENLDKGDWKHV
ncbi:M42 family metallopeptidase [bacterium]|nr:M42 family metallopeptidase [bacterium]NCQ54792.1 M42 family metallopeptidase [Candidatus Parcubacteria bacterium]NCS66836.1 M42 family metallopeptidase [Candidatus Peregrinibacteria bacterium]NCS95782.1 M42 family metallopeptidase [bacterium]